MILIVDDNQGIGEALGLLLDLNGYDSEFVSSPGQALQRIQEVDVDLVIQDMNFELDTNSGEEGQALFYALRSLKPDLPIILMTAWTHLDMAVSLVKAGAADYISKPWDDTKLLVTIDNLLQMAQLQIENSELVKSQQQHALMDQQLQAEHDLCGLIYQSPVMQRLVDMACQVAPSDVPIFISGPNGAGKEKIAEIIQANSRRADKPFIKVNVGALSADLMEAELFGAEKGAFTGADKQRIGRFEAADGGTLFLDEMGNLPLSGQAKLLRTLQSGEFERVGSSNTLKVDVRIITATNRDLTQAIADGEFREDLYYRLNVIELKVPALKDREQDITVLAQHFLQQLNGSNTQVLANEALDAMQAYQWPGNVRELFNRMQRACLLSQGPTISCDDIDLPVAAQEANSVSALDIDQDRIREVLDQHGGVVAKAARALGISRQALYRRLGQSKTKSQ